MSNSHHLFDRSAILAHRARARRMGFVGFLHEQAIDEIHERLSDINREFTRPAIVTAFPEIWADLLPDAQIVPDDEVLALEPASHDLVIHAMCLHMANDPIGQLIQCRRALVPDGLLLACMMGGETLSELRAALSEAEIKLSGGLSPRIAPMAEIRDLGALLQRAGLALPVADSVKLTVMYRALRGLLHDLRGMAETNAMAARQKTCSPRDLFSVMERIYSEEYANGEGLCPASFETIYLTGWAPDESQQQPLRPGSAKSRLADFLKTTELGEDAKPVTREKDQ